MATIEPTTAPTMVPATPRKEAASAEVAAARALAITCAGLRPRKPSGASRVVAAAVVTVEGERDVIELADGELDLGGMAKRLPGLLLGGARRHCRTHPWYGSPLKAQTVPAVPVATPARRAGPSF